MRRSTVSASFFEVRISRNSRFASASSRSFGVDQLERARGGPHRVGMEGEIVLLRQMEQPDQVDRIALEHVGARDVDAVVVDDEIVGLARARRLRAGRSRAITRLSTGAGLAWRSSRPAHRMAVRSPTSLAVRK